MAFAHHLFTSYCGWPSCLAPGSLKSIVQLLNFSGLLWRSENFGMGMDVTTVTLSNPFLTSPMYLKFVPYPGNNLFLVASGFNRMPPASLSGLLSLKACLCLCLSTLCFLFSTSITVAIIITRTSTFIITNSLSIYQLIILSTYPQVFNLF